MPPPREETFRLILLSGFLVFGPVMFWFRLKSQTGEKLDRRQEGLAMLVGLRLAAVVPSVAVVAYLVEPRAIGWASLPVPVVLRYGGVALGLLAGVLIVWTFLNLGPNLTDTVVTRREHSLVTTGPYRWVRHPFYVATGLVILAVSLITANALVFGTGALILLLLIIRTRTEERFLLTRFGEGYRRYMDRTGRFIPRCSWMGRKKQ